MARADDDTWDITEGVGATALAVAMARAAESQSECALFDDPYAQLFIDAANERGWRSPFGGQALAEMPGATPEFVEKVQRRLTGIRAYAISRTKLFDDFFIAAGAAGITQVVILAAGLDARAWRLPWVSGTVVYEIDQPKVLEFKAETLSAHDAVATARDVAVPVDLRQDWPTALRQKGFDPTQPTAWLAEGLLPYLPAAGQDLLFERLNQLSALDSRVAVEAFGDDYFDDEYQKRTRERVQALRAAAGTSADQVTDVSELFYAEPRTNVADWLREHGWQVGSTDAAALMDRYHRDLPDDMEPMPTAFVEGILVADVGL
jgi:methyltransferase (TIGR00027 family)